MKMRRMRVQAGASAVSRVGVQYCRGKQPAVFQPFDRRRAAWGHTRLG